jgi:hypothetical protein
MVALSRAPPSSALSFFPGADPGLQEACDRECEEDYQPAERTDTPTTAPTKKEAEAPLPVRRPNLYESTERETDSRRAAAISMIGSTNRVSLHV